MQVIKPIAYEILRRDDGMVAISTNAGLIDFEPGFIRIRHGNVFVHEQEARPGQPETRQEDLRAVELVDVGGDVIERAVRDKVLRLFEFASFGLTGAHTLAVVA